MYSVDLQYPSSSASYIYIEDLEDNINKLKIGPSTRDMGHEGPSVYRKSVEKLRIA